MNCEGYSNNKRLLRTLTPACFLPKALINNPPWRESMTLTNTAFVNLENSIFSLTSISSGSFDLCSPPVENLCHLWCSHLSPHCTSVGKLIMLQMKPCLLRRLMFQSSLLFSFCLKHNGEGQWILAHLLFTRFMFI